MITCGLPRRLLAAVGDANDPRTWSGIPYHFLQAAKAAGLLDEGLPLAVDAPAWRLRRWSWNAVSVLSGDRPGGYQYSVPFLERLWASHRDRLQGAVIINCFQLYPPSLVADALVEKWFFIDQTLLQLLDHYGQRPVVGRRVVRQAVERERDGYHAAAGVIVFSQWAAASVVGQYGISSARVHIVAPGANLDSDAYASWEREEERRRAGSGHAPRDPRQRLRLVFVGKEWRRKGLDRLLRGFALARRQGCNATLRVIGCGRESLPASLRDVAGVEWCGFIDKQRDAERFLRMVAECDVGCLLSRADASPIALREYVALGLMVLSTDVGGVADQVVQRASVVLPAQGGDEETAAVLLDLWRHEEEVSLRRAAAWERRRSALWVESVNQMQALWPRPVCRSSGALADAAPEGVFRAGSAVGRAGP